MLKPGLTILYIIFTLCMVACGIDQSTYSNAFKEVTQKDLPDNSVLIYNEKSSVDFFGDYHALAVYELSNSFQYMKTQLSIITPRDTAYHIPERVNNYFNNNLSKHIIQDYYYEDPRGLELYGAVLSDHKTVVVYRSSW